MCASVACRTAVQIRRLGHATPPRLSNWFVCRTEESRPAPCVRRQSSSSHRRPRRRRLSTRVRPPRCSSSAPARCAARKQTCPTKPHPSPPASSKAWWGSSPAWPFSREERRRGLCASPLGAPRPARTRGGWRLSPARTLETVAQLPCSGGDRKRSAPDPQVGSLRGGAI